jgi:sugar phosphate isomerase/epimerase
MQLYHWVCVRPHRRKGHVLNFSSRKLHSTKSGVAMTRPPSSLAPLCLLEIGPPEIVAIAAQAGFHRIGLRLEPAAPETPFYPLRVGDAAFEETRRLMSSHGVDVYDVEMICLDHRTKVADFETMFAAAQALGAQRVTVAGDEPDRGAMVEAFGTVCDLAAKYNLGVDIEFMIWRSVATIDDAAAVVSAAGRRNGGILVDFLHLFRSGGDVAALKRINPALIRSCQICDALLSAPPGEGHQRFLDEARTNRLLPGTGELPIRAILDALPSDVSISAEIPLRGDAYPSDPIEKLRVVHDAVSRAVGENTN